MSAQLDLDFAPTSSPERTPKIVFFDLETIRSADEVGGWGAADKMGLAVAALYDSSSRRYHHFFESDVADLIARLIAADLVVGFNHIRFDYKVLLGYSSIDLEKRTRSFDIMLDLADRLGRFIGLGAIATASLGEGKSGDGLQSLKWWREGEKEKVVRYCMDDVRITKELFEYGLNHHELLYTSKGASTSRSIKLDWNLSSILGGTESGWSLDGAPISF